MCILNGFNTVLTSTTTNAFPFGVWFADANTLYVADEGDGYAGGLNLDTHAAAQTTAGLQKWVFNGSTWTLAYTLQKGLALGTPYTVTGYPTGLNLATCVVPKGTPGREPQQLPDQQDTDGGKLRAGWSSLGARHRWPPQPHRTGQLQRNGDYLCDNVDRQRRRRPGRGS